MLAPRAGPTLLILSLRSSPRSFNCTPVQNHHAPLSLCPASLALVLGATASTVTHIKLETHTLTVHGSSITTTARPFGGKHSGKHSRHRHRVDGKKTKPHSREQKSDEHVSKKSHDGKLSKKKDLKENAKVSSRGGCSSTHKVHDKSEPHKTTKKHADAVKTKTATVHKSPSTTKPSSTKETSKPKKDDKASSPVVSNVPVKKPSVLLAESSSPSLSKLAQDSLKLHNDLRSKHKVDSLTWSDELASAAQDWADLCVFQHGKGEEIGAGENLAAYTGADNVASAFDMWSNEVSEYNFDAPGFASNTAHFTQVVWKGTTQVGCAQTLCPTLPIPGQSPFTNAFFYVCEYKAAGNIVGSTPEDTAKSFAANVLK